MKKMNRNVFRVSLLCISFALLVISCGKKGPPIAPKYTIPTPVTDLQGKVEGDTVILNWTIPENVKGIAGYIVYRNRIALSEPECPTCPVLFERVIDVPVLEKEPDKMKDKVMSYSETVEKGFRYIYKVNPYMEGGRIGKDSNLFVFKSDNTSGPGKK